MPVFALIAQRRLWSEHLLLSLPDSFCRISLVFLALTLSTKKMMTSPWNCRKCCRSDLQGRRRASVHQRHVAGLGHFPSTQLRRTTFGSGGRRVVFIRRGPACFGMPPLSPRSREHRRKADVEDGVALKEARRSKEATCLELCRGDGGARHGHCWGGPRQGS